MIISYLCTTNEVKDMLRLPRLLDVYNLLRKGIIPATRIDNRILIEKKDVLKFMSDYAV